MSGEFTELNNDKNNNDPYNFNSLRAMAKDPEIRSAIDDYADGDGIIGNVEHKDVLEDDPILWQSECLERIKHEKNVILSSPTGSGKTRVFLEWAKDKKEQSEAEGKKHTIYITAPIKALSNQRFRELQEAGVNVGLEPVI